MKISQSTIQLSSYHSAEELDLLQEETSKETVKRTSSVISTGSNNPIWAKNPFAMPTILVDRVSLSHHENHEVQSEYNHSLSSHSKVTSADDGTTVEYDQQEFVEKLVGAVMDRDVVIRTLRNGDDIRLGSGVGAGLEPVSAVETSSTESLVTMNRTQIHYEEEQMGFSSQGQVVTEDGRTIEFSLDLAMDRAYLSKTEEQTLIHTWQEEVEVTLIDPLVISLDGSLPQLTDTKFEFDLNSDGFAEEVSFVSKGSGFLSFDKNNDGVINNGSELFGPGTGNGFGELGEYDLDNNGWIDENDAVFSQLSVWTRDEEGNDVLVSLADAGVGAIYLDNAQAQFNMTSMDNELNGELRRSGVFLFENGNVGAIQQIDLAAKTAEDAVIDLSQDVQNMVSSQVIDVPVGPGQIAPSISQLRAEPITETLDPIKELIDQLKAIREQLRELLDQGEGNRQSLKRVKNQGLSFSKTQLYSMTHPDATRMKQPMGWHI